MSWLTTETIDAGSPPSPDNWRTLEVSLQPYAGKTVGIIIEVAYGGKSSDLNEEAFFDEISIIPQK